MIPPYKYYDISLKDLLKHQQTMGVPITEAEVFHITRSMVDALHHLWKHGFAHTHITVTLSFFSSFSVH
jgi:serine/threonine protein kinase